MRVHDTLTATDRMPVASDRLQCARQNGCHRLIALSCLPFSRSRSRSRPQPCHSHPHAANLSVSSLTVVCALSPAVCTHPSGPRSAHFSPYTHITLTHRLHAHTELIQRLDRDHWHNALTIHSHSSRTTHTRSAITQCTHTHSAITQSTHTAQ